MKTLLTLLIFSISYTIQAQDISGHWHIHSDNYGDNGLLTLDIINNKAAFFNISQVDSPDKAFYEAYIKDYTEKFDTSFTNVNLKKRYITPFSWTKIPKSSKLIFEIISDDKLLLHGVDNKKSDFTALRSKGCEETDFCTFNTSFSNPFCEMTYDLPDTNWEGLVDTNRFSGSLICDLYLGLHTTYSELESWNSDGNKKLDSIPSTRVTLNFNREGHIDFDDLPKRYADFLNRVPIKKLRRWDVKFHVDEKVPVVYLQYIQNILMLAHIGLRRIYFVNKKGNLVGKEHPNRVHDQKLPSGIFTIPEKKLYSDFCAPHSNHYDPSNYQWVSVKPFFLGRKVFRYQPKLMEIDPAWKEITHENQLRINISKDGQLLVNEQQTAISELSDICYQKLPKSNEEKYLLIYLRTHSEVNSGIYMEVHGEIYRAFHKNLNEMSLKFHGLPFDKITAKEQKDQLLRYFPVPILECMY